MDSITSQKLEKTNEIQRLTDRRFDRLNDHQRKKLVQGLTLVLAGRLTNKELGEWLGRLREREAKNE